MRWSAGEGLVGVDFCFQKLGLSRILSLHEDAGVLQSVEQSMAPFCPSTIVFIVTDFLWDAEDTLVKMMSNFNASFRHIVVLSAIPELSHIEVQARTNYPDSPFSFEGFAEYIADCTSQRHGAKHSNPPRVSVRDFPAASFSSVVSTSPIDLTLSPHFKPVPISLRQSCVGAFFSNVPRCANAFPLTYADFEREERKRRQATPAGGELDPAVFRAHVLGDNFSKATADRIPSAQRTDYNVLAHDLAGFCKQHDLIVSESVFAVGFTSRLLARKVVDLNGRLNENTSGGDEHSRRTSMPREGEGASSHHRLRRRRKCSLILVDRTVDLATPTSRASFIVNGDRGSQCVPLLDLMSEVLTASSSSNPTISETTNATRRQRLRRCCQDVTVLPIPEDDFGSLDAPVTFLCTPQLSKFAAKCGDGDCGGGACLSSAADVKHAVSLQLLATIGCKEAVHKFHHALVAIMKNEGVCVPTPLRVVKDKPAIDATSDTDAFSLGFGGDTLFRCLSFLFQEDDNNPEQAECRRRVVQKHKPFLKCVVCALEALARVRKLGGAYCMPHLDQLQRMLFEQSCMSESSSSILMQFCDVFNNTANFENLGGFVHLLTLLLHMCAVIGPQFEFNSEDPIMMLQGALMRALLKMDVENLRHLGWLDDALVREIVKIAKLMDKRENGSVHLTKVEDDNTSRSSSARSHEDRKGQDGEGDGWDDWSDEDDGGDGGGWPAPPLTRRDESSGRFDIASEDPSHHKVFLDLEARVEDITRRFVDCARYQIQGNHVTNTSGIPGFLDHLCTSLVDPARPDLQQTCKLEHISSLLNTALQQGGLLRGMGSMLFGEGSRAVPHPMDNPTVVIFVVGGLTFQELQTMQSIFSTHPVIAPQDGTESGSFVEILVGSTCVATADFIYDKVVA